MSKGVIVLNKKEVPIIQVGVTNRVRKVTAADHFVSWLVGFVALRPKSTAMVIAGRSVHLATLFSWAGLNKGLTSNLCTYFRL